MTSSEIKELLNQIKENLENCHKILIPFKNNKLDNSQYTGQKLASLINHLNIIEDEVIEYRLQKVIREEHPFLPEIDLARIEDHVRNRNLQLDELIDEFLRQRQELINFLSNTPLSSWKRTGILSYEGHITLYDLVCRFKEKADHNLDNLRKLTA